MMMKKFQTVVVHHMLHQVGQTMIYVVSVKNIQNRYNTIMKNSTIWPQLILQENRTKLVGANFVIGIHAPV